ncbi:LOW QUALITY PROTEIN: pyrin domain-containing protein 3-like [Arvicola amphibius]|uniref:LOW QUALITY PROTEIN: pyrin domain-containing protein 3-like n=1 Tax=Arvicola amphibius TaxID=1047088 RepID=UPI0018E3388B|nr:LOW QUALITY PROTEIN: pyrin domain-containing protein 3-like [Arvicola amphibius]
MVNEYKRIVLLKGLQCISDYDFRIVKSLLIHDLQLTKKMQDEYDRIKIADLMEEKFQKDAGLSVLIELYQDIPELEDLVDTLRKEMAEVENKSKRKAEHAAIGPSQNESSTSHLVSNTEEDLELGSTMAMPSSKKPEDALTKSPDIVTTQSFQEEHKLSELSTANRCPVVSEPQTPQGLPMTAYSSLQTPLEPPELSHTILTTSQGPSAPFSTSNRTSQVSPVMDSSSIHTSQVMSPVSYSHQDPLKSQKTVPKTVPVFQASPVTMTRAVQTSWTPKATEHSSDQAFPVTPATMTSGYNSPLMSAAALSGSYNTPQVTPATVHSSDQTSQVTPATVPSSVQAFLVTPATTASGYNSPQVSAATVSGSYNTLQVTPAAMPRSFNPPPQSPASWPSNASMQQVSLATTSRSSFATLVSPATPFKKPRLKTVPQQPSQEDGYHQGPKEVMVLKATEIFTYDMGENRMMFHATVATETEFFRVKVFDIVLKEKFIPNKVIVISDYTGHNGFLEIYRASSVSDVNGTNMMDIPLSLRQRANATPKINTICSQRVGTFVNGVFAVYMKIVKDEFIYYGIEDNTGKMEVVVHGQFTNMYCEPGDKLRLFCFELSSGVDTWHLRSGRHSYLQVIRTRRRDMEPPNAHSAMEMYLNSNINTTEQH